MKKAVWHIIVNGAYGTIIGYFYYIIIIGTYVPNYDHDENIISWLLFEIVPGYGAKETGFYFQSKMTQPRLESTSLRIYGSTVRSSA